MDCKYILDIFFKIALLPTSFTTISIIFIFIWYFYNRSIAQRGLSLLFFSIIFNNFLKNCFQIPLLPEIGDHTWAFPSGHMSSSFIVFFWLSYEIKKTWLWVLSVTISSLVGCALCYFGYHSVVDIMGSVFFSTLILIAFDFLLKRFPTLVQMNILLLLTAVSIVVFGPLLIPAYKKSCNEWLFFGGALGITLGLFLNSAHTQKMTMKQLILALILFFIGGIGINHTVDTLLGCKVYPSFFYCFKGVLLTFYLNIPLYIVIMGKKELE